MNFLSFDIETYSPNGFPYSMEDPIVNFSLVAPWTRKGLFCVSFLAGPMFENETLSLLYKLLMELEGCFLLTYNGSRFDLPYTIERGRLYGLDFAEVFSRVNHWDVYQEVKCLNLGLPRYDQKSVERFFGISRVLRDVDGSSYCLFFEELFEGGGLKPMFYNIEDSFGCLRIADGVLKRKCARPLVFY
jgi:uncharacterized protein YprB with RNaseH-like and TPR domain